MSKYAKIVIIIIIIIIITIIIEFPTSQFSWEIFTYPGM